MRSFLPQRPALIFGLACVTALAVGLLVYLPGLPGDFVFDDFSSIVSNPAVTAAHHDLAGLLDAMLSAPIGGLLRPLSMLSLILNAQLFGLSPFGFKLVNIFIHLACGGLLGFLAREVLLVHARSIGRPADTQRIAWLSLAAAALWLVHPLNLTAVLYIVQRETSLSALFSAAAMLAYLIGRRRGIGTRNGAMLIWLTTPLCVLLGMLCKETAALVPVYLLVVEFTLLDFRDGAGRRDRKVLAFFVVFLALPLIAALVLAAVRPGFFFASYLGRDFTLYQRLLSECRVLLDYLRWLFIPDLRQLGLFHDDVAVSHGLLEPTTTLPAVLLLVALAAGALACRRRHPLFSFGVLWFLAGHLMESTILPLELVFEHRNYLPAFGPILACVAGIYALCEKRGLGRLAKTLGIAVFTILALTTAMRALDWQTELDFGRSEARHHPGSPRALTELQWAYMRYVIVSGDTQLIPAAVQAAEQAKTLEPGSINQDVGLAFMYAKLGQLPDAHVRLRSAADRVGEAAPTSSLQSALQALLQLTGPEDQVLREDARAVFKGAFANPRFRPQPCYVANAWNTYSIFQEDTGELPGASAALQQAVNLCPRDQTLHSNFAHLLLRYHDMKDAEAQIEALEAVHDYRFSADLLVLKREYARQAGNPP